MARKAARALALLFGALALTMTYAHVLALFRKLKYGADAPALGAVHTTASCLVHAPPERVVGIYQDYSAWPRVFGRTISAVRLVGESGAEKTVEVDHTEGRVLNVMSVVAPDEIRLEEWKRHYLAQFTNRFEPVPGGTRYTIVADVVLKGAFKALAPIARPFVRARMRRFVLDPIKRAAEGAAPASTGPSTTVFG